MAQSAHASQQITKPTIQGICKTVSRHCFDSNWGKRLFTSPKAWRRIESDAKPRASCTRNLPCNIVMFTHTHTRARVENKIRIRSYTKRLCIGKLASLFLESNRDFGRCSLLNNTSLNRKPCIPSRPCFPCQRKALGWFRCHLLHRYWWKRIRPHENAQSGPAIVDKRTVTQRHRGGIHILWVWNGRIKQNEDT